MSLTITDVRSVVAGNRRINLANVTVETTGINAMVPEEVGMHKIEGVKVIKPVATTVMGAEYDGTSLTLYDDEGVATATTVSTTATLEFVGW